MPTESETEAANILTTIKSVIREQSPLHSVSTIIPMHDEKYGNLFNNLKIFIKFFFNF